jgi:sugar O-acyltransferase (sialic acid O-acetyltransferase NeuD family)
MARDLVIFGTGEYAQQMHHYFSADPGHRVVAFSVDAAFVTQPSFCGLPVIPFEAIVASADPRHCDMYIAVGYQRLNETRRSKCLAARALGYSLASYVHPTAVVARGVTVQDNSFVGEMALVRPFASLGWDVQIGPQASIGHHAVVQDHCYIAARAMLCGAVNVGECCFIGANATVRDHVAVGDRCVIGAGAVILSDCEPAGVYRAEATPRSAVGSRSLRRI